MYTCVQLFLQPPLTQYYFCKFFRNFKEVPPKPKMLEMKQETPTEPTGPPVHQKIHLDEVCAGLVPQLAKKNTCAI